MEGGLFDIEIETVKDSLGQELSLKRYAAIDIGSNTILLLIGRITAEGALEVVLDCGKTTRLGKGLQEEGKLDPVSVQTSIDCLQGFYFLCQKEGVEEIAAVGTNALRLARDAEQFIQHVRQKCSISLRVIDEAEEAILSFLSVQKDPRMPRDAVVIDVGGGSTEYIFRHDKGPSYPMRTISLPLGAVSLTEKYVNHDPPSSDEVTKLRHEIEKALLSIPITLAGELVGVGGTVATLGSMHRGLDKFNQERIHGLQLTIDELTSWVKKLQEKNLARRKKIKGLPHERADIIFAGAMIILSSMERLGKETIYISCHGLRYGLFHQRFMGIE
jgi:exopolyphosphatase/guanosine-5'-triphosphate,3'-diphosphate pyrophosphatase